MNITDTTAPSSNLPDTLSNDDERNHVEEDEYLWSFVAFVFGFCNGDNPEEQFLRKEAKAFLDWDDKHAKRIRWYA